MKNFLTSKDEFPPVKCRVFTDYDQLDALAEKRGYKSVECMNDDKVATRIGAGLQNTNLHSGWIATMGDSQISVQTQLSLLKDKISECLKRGESVIIGFCQTGHFSIGYSLYVKRK